MSEITDQKMALVFGMPRSGTTWIGKLLDSHPDSYYLHEPDTVYPNFNIPLLVEPAKIASLQDETRPWLDEIMTRQNPTVTAFPPIFPKNYMTQLQLAILKSTTVISRLDRRMGSPFKLRPVRHTNHSKSLLVVWKSIESLGRIELILSICTNAQPLHLLRHPCGHVNSTLKGLSRNKFGTDAPAYEDWDLFDKLITQSDSRQFDLTDIKSMTPEERLTFRWGIMNDHCAKALSAKDALTVRYEDVCDNPSAETERMLNWLGLNMATQTEKFISSSTAQDQDAYYGTTKDPRKSAYSWMKALTDQQVDRVMSMASNFTSGRYYAES